MIVMWGLAVVLAVVCVGFAIGALVWAWRMKPPPFRPEDLPEYSSATARVGSLPDVAVAVPDWRSYHDDWRISGPIDPTPSITCPDCGMTSYNGTDIAQGFCGNCHAWTALRPPPKD